MIDHREGNEIDVIGPAAQPSPRDAQSIHQDQSFFGQQAAQVNLHGAVPAIGDVLVDGRTRLLRQPVEQVGGVAHTQFLNVLRTVCVHRIRPGLFRSRNVRPGHDHPFGLGFVPRGRSCCFTGGWWRGVLSEYVKCEKKRNSDARCKSNANRS